MARGVPGVAGRAMGCVTIVPSGGVTDVGGMGTPARVIAQPSACDFPRALRLRRIGEKGNADLRSRRTSITAWDGLTRLVSSWGSRPGVSRSPLRSDAGRDLRAPGDASSRWLYVRCREMEQAATQPRHSWNTHRCFRSDSFSEKRGIQSQGRFRMRRGKKFPSTSFFLRCD